MIAHHLADTPAGRAPSTLEPSELSRLNKVGLIANISTRPEFSVEAIKGARFFIHGDEIIGLPRYLVQKVRGMVSSTERASIPEFDIRLPALTEFISSFRSYKLPDADLPPNRARERGGQVFAQACASCHSSQRPLEAMDRLDRTIRLDEAPLENNNAEFYRGARFSRAKTG